VNQRAVNQQSMQMDMHLDPHGLIHVNVVISAIAKPESVWVMAQTAAMMFCDTVLGRQTTLPPLEELPSVGQDNNQIQYHYRERLAPRKQEA